eukprot:4506908-Ditylum_brightwellii.AAC.1
MAASIFVSALESPLRGNCAALGATYHVKILASANETSIVFSSSLPATTLQCRTIRRLSMEYQ